MEDDDQRATKTSIIHQDNIKTSKLRLDKPQQQNSDQDIEVVQERQIQPRSLLPPDIMDSEHHPLQKVTPTVDITHEMSDASTSIESDHEKQPSIVHPPRSVIPSIRRVPINMVNNKTYITQQRNVLPVNGTATVLAE